MGHRLVIVESPAKARTIAGYLGDGFVVESSIGHIRDLPSRASDVPAEERARFGTLGVDVEGGFEPYYIVDADKKRVVADLRKKLADADELLLATDEDREGEAIAWHLLQVLKPKKGVAVRRMVFHEITHDAIHRALETTREINVPLVDAQETRRILDRLYGFEVSPVLWKKVMPRLSAGRVQSVATRIVVERERERMAFTAAGYWDIIATFDPDLPDAGAFEARLVAVDGRRVARGSNFGSDGRPADTVVVLDEDAATTLASGLQGCRFAVTSVEEKPYRRSPSDPFRTSTLQQEASRKLRFSAQTTMRVAQKLYEAGHITYMRTDSVSLSDTAISAARAHAERVFGAHTVPAAPRRYDRAVKNAQEAHEAVRPAGDVFRTPESLARELNRDESALYELVFRRTVASQMNDAVGQTVSIQVEGKTVGGTRATFGAAGTVITSPGFRLAYETGTDEPGEDDDERGMPALEVEQVLQATELRPDGHETKPPSRYTEASLVKALEDRGIGRPSTYASIMGTILDRGYVFKKGTALVPTFLAFAVTQLLEGHFSQLVDYDFTADMENDLDQIASGEMGREAWLKNFYLGGDSPDSPGLKALVNNLVAIDARKISEIAIPGTDTVVRVGRYGPYIQEGEKRLSLPDDIVPDELSAAAIEELLARPSGDRELGADPATGHVIAARDGRYGPYVSEVLPEGDSGKPRTASLFASMALDTMTLDDALRLLTLPRVLTAPDGEEILVSNGRYGPFVKKGAETRSLPGEEMLLTVTVEEALAVLAQPKERRERGAPKPPLATVGTDPGSGKTLVVKDGKFGAYVTDGETNATLRRGDDHASLTLERALELLAEKRAKGPSQPRKRATHARKRPSGR